MAERAQAFEHHYSDNLDLFLSREEEELHPVKQAEVDAESYADLNGDPASLARLLSGEEPLPGAQLEAAWGATELARHLETDRRFLPRAKALYSKAYIRRLIMIYGARELGRRGGRRKTEVKAAAVRLNGMKGGRPKGSKNKPKVHVDAPAETGRRVWKPRLVVDDRQQPLL